MVNILFTVLAVSITAILFSGIKVKRIVAVGTVIIISALTGITAVQSLIGQAFEVILDGPLMFGNIPLRINALSAWFILIINFTAITGAIYGSGYLETEKAQSHLITSHWILYIIFHTSMLLVCMVQHSVAFIVLWEIMSVSSFMGVGLIGLSYENSMMVFLGFGGALLHVLNHSLFKSLLFFSAGSVYRRTSTRDMDRLGDMIKTMPRTAILFLIGAVAIGGIPPLNGFVSEFLNYSGIIEGIGDHVVAMIILMIITIAGISRNGGISILAFTKAFGTIFLGTPRQVEKMDFKEVPEVMLIPQYIIAALMVVIGTFPGFFMKIAAIVLSRGLLISVHEAGIHHYTSVLNNIAFASFILIGITASIFVFKYFSAKRTDDNIAATWGCGCMAPHTGMQYTGKSFSKSFGKLLNFILIEKKVYDEIGEAETFPTRRKYSSFYLDFFEIRLIDPVLKNVPRFNNIFHFIQNGRIQAYVLYGIIFLIAIFIGTLLKFLP